MCVVVFDVCNDCNKHYEVRVTGGETESGSKGAKRQGTKAELQGLSQNLTYPG